MEMCSGEGRGSHDEVVFDGGQCPLCELYGKADDAQKEIDEAAADVEGAAQFIKKLMVSRLDQFGYADADTTVQDLLRRQPLLNANDIDKILSTLESIDLDITLDV